MLLEMVIKKNQFDLLQNKYIIILYLFCKNVIMFLNSREYQPNQSLFVEKNIDMTFQIKKNPE